MPRREVDPARHFYAVMRDHKPLRFDQFGGFDKRPVQVGELPFGAVLEYMDLAGIRGGGSNEPDQTPIRVWRCPGNGAPATEEIDGSPA